LKWPFSSSDGFELGGESVESVGDKRGVDGLDGVAVRGGGSAAEQNAGCDGEHLLELRQFDGQPIVVFGVHHAEGKDGGPVLANCARQICGWQGWAEIKNVPSNVCGSGGRHDCSELVQLSCGGCEHNARRVNGG
jgi:hypothetical protein